MLVSKCLLKTPLFLYWQSYLVQDNPEPTISAEPGIEWQG